MRDYIKGRCGCCAIRDGRSPICVSPCRFAFKFIFWLFFSSSSILRSPFHSPSGNIGQVLMAQSFFLLKRDFSVMQMTIKTQLPLLNLALTTGKTISLFLPRYNLLLENKTLSKHYRKKRCTFFSLAWEMWFMPLFWLWIKKGLCKWKNDLLREKYSFLHPRLLEKNPCVQNCCCMLFWTDTMCQLHGTHGNTFFYIQKNIVILSAYLRKHTIYHKLGTFFLANKTPVVTHGLCMLWSL